MLNGYYIIFLSLFIFNLAISFAFSVKIFHANWIWSVSIAVITFFSINTLSGLLGFYLCGNQMHREGWIAAEILLLLLISFILIKKQDKIVLENENTYLLLGIFLVVFTALVCSTNREFLPIWGNVDEVAHLDLISHMYNCFSVEKPLDYLGLMDFEFSIYEYSYLWGHHYNCALISYVTQINILYVSHFLRCLYAAALVACPIVMMKNMRWYMNIAYIILILFNYNSWYIFLNRGYTPQLYALFFCFFVVGVMCCVQNKEITKLGTLFLLPMASLLGLLSYLLVGVLLSVFVLFYYWNKGLKRKSWIVFVYALGIIPQPSVWGVIIDLLHMEKVHTIAIQDNHWMSDRPTIIWLLVAVAGIILFMLRAKMKEQKLFGIWGVLFLFPVILLYVVSPYSYILHKYILMTSFVWMPITIECIGWFINKYIKLYLVKIVVFSGIFIISVFALVKVKIWNMQLSIFPITGARQQITKDNLQCFDRVLNVLTDEDAVEYLGYDGVRAFLGSIILGKSPYSYWEEGHQWRYRGSFSMENLIKGILERVRMESGEDNVYLLIDKKNLTDFDMLKEYFFLIGSLENLYESANGAVWKLTLNLGLDFNKLDVDDLANVTGYLPKNIQAYGEALIFPEKEKEYTVDVPIQKNAKINVVILEGRVNNGSEFILKGLWNGECVFEECVEDFNKIHPIVLPFEVNCDELQITALSKQFSDSIIIKDIYYGVK